MKDAPPSIDALKDDTLYNMRPLFDAILKHVPVRNGRSGRPAAVADLLARLFQAMSARSASAAFRAARIKPLQDVVVMNGPDSTPVKARINQVLTFEGLERVVSEEAVAGDIVLVNGIEDIGIGSTICAPEQADALPMLKGRRADADHELHGQQLAARRSRRQVRHQPPDTRASRARGQKQRRAESRVHPGFRHVHRFRTGRAAPDILLENMRREATRWASAGRAW